MAASEWLRTFVAIYRAGSVTEGAALRHLSQPAASQQLAALERATGTPLFVRSPTGVTPTRWGRALYGRVVGPLDNLEELLDGLDTGTLPAAPTALRFGSTAEEFSTHVLPRLRPDGPAISATFGPDEEVVALLGHGELDVAVTRTAPPRRAFASTPLGTTGFALVAAPDLAPDRPPASLADLGRWLVGRPWVAYSAELPLTRRFWQSALGRPFAGDLRLVAPDLRAVVGAVERSLGISLLPEDVCADHLADGRIVELFPVGGVVPGESRFACTRAADVGRPAVAALVDALRAGGDARPGRGGRPGGSGVRR
jgi:DNA-binding transcriptional LysR family regulator